MKYVCQVCGTEFSRLTVWFGGQLKCKVCHAKYARNITLASFLFIGPVAWFSVWLGIWQKNPSGILLFVVSWIGYRYFCRIQKDIEYEDLLKNK
jgi:hypothetical protein